MEKLKPYMRPAAKTPEEAAAEVQQRQLAIIQNLRKQMPATVGQPPMEADMEELTEEELALKKTLGLA